jgi:hypothetical protein
VQNWFWAARNTGPAGDAFIVENGKDALWARVRREISADENCSWNAVHPKEREPGLEDILNMMFTVVPTYRVNHNQFVFEMAKIPAFARFLRNAPNDLANYVSNSAFPEVLIPLEAYSPDATKKLGAIASSTLGIDDDWFEY